MCSTLDPPKCIALSLASSTPRDVHILFWMSRLTGQSCNLCNLEVDGIKMTTPAAPVQVPKRGIVKQVRIARLIHLNCIDLVYNYLKGFLSFCVRIPRAFW